MVGSSALSPSRSSGTAAQAARLWHSVRYEEVYVCAYDSMGAARVDLARHLELYKARRPHQAHVEGTPDMVNFQTLMPMQASA
jgi:putative transposase